MTNKRIKIIQIFPVLIIAIVMINTLYNFMVTDYFATIRHQFAVIVFFINILFYRFYFKMAIIYTGVFLFLASFNILAMWPNIISTSYFFKINGIEISTPEFDWRTLLIFLLYIFCNFSYFIDLYVENKSIE